MTASPWADVVRYWNEEGGAAWVANADRFDAQLLDHARALLAAAHPLHGERVLDVGCGTGALGRLVAGSVEPGGHVVGVDVSRPMLGLARERAEAAGLPATYLEADAQAHDLTAEGPFDLWVSRFGVMFFTDAFAAFENLVATLRPGGRLAFVCWQAYEANPWLHVPMEAALAVVPPPEAPPPGAPGPFSLGDREHVLDLLAGAGTVDARVEPLELDVALGGWGGASEVVDFLKATSMGRMLLQQDDPALQERVVAAVRDALAAHEEDERVVLPSAAWLVTARRP